MDAYNKKIKKIEAIMKEQTTMKNKRQTRKGNTTSRNEKYSLGNYKKLDSITE